MKKSQFKAAVVCTLAVGLAGYGYVQSPHRAPPSPRDLKPRKGALRIRPAEAAHVKFVKYHDPSGYFTMNVPLGWRVKTGLKPDGKIDLISYAITVYDPKRPERELYFCLNNAVGLKSAEARNWYIRSYGPKSYFAQMPVLPKLSTAGFFAAMGPRLGTDDSPCLKASEGARWAGTWLWPNARPRRDGACRASTTRSSRG